VAGFTRSGEGAKMPLEAEGFFIAPNLAQGAIAGMEGGFAASAMASRLRGFA
jgi:hypothetical protein